MTKRNGLKKMPLSRIKDMVKYGSATTITSINEQLRNKITQIASSIGKKGVNGGLFVDDKGKYYATIGASTINDYFSN